MLPIIVLIIVALIAALLIYAASRPASFRIERSTAINAPPEKIFPLINDFHRWNAWSPWEKLDEGLKRTFSGPASGKGAVYEWLGNNKVGQGRMEITDATAPSKVTIKLDFLKPFEAHNTAEFTLAPQGGATRVNWAMYGASPYMARLMGLVFNMDKMLGASFDQGLANLKAQAES